MKHYENVGLAGTFDRLHEGHKLFLDLAAHYGQFVHVGLVTSSYLEKTSKNYRQIIQSYQDRRRGVEHYLSERKAKNQISDIDTPGKDRELANEANLSALVVSQETCRGAIAINRLRNTHGKSKLTIIITPRVVCKDGVLISSTRLRMEETKTSCD